ncbi:hypothetical protein FRC03_006804, partial [Tulasnella sp. 419]
MEECMALIALESSSMVAEEMTQGRERNPNSCPNLVSSNVFTTTTPPIVKHQSLQCWNYVSSTLHYKLLYLTEDTWQVFEKGWPYEIDTSPIASDLKTM